MTAQAVPAKSGLSITSGFQQTFTVSAEAELSFGPPRQSPIGPDITRTGEITISLAPAGGAAGVAKLHVFERSAVPIGFTATAWQGEKVIAVAKLCGHRELDSWVALPAGTTRVDVSDFVTVEDGCT